MVRFEVLIWVMLAAVLPGCSVRPKCKDSCYTKFLAGDERSNCLSQCDLYYKLQDRKGEPKHKVEPLPELVIPQ